MSKQLRKLCRNRKIDTSPINDSIKNQIFAHKEYIESLLKIDPVELKLVKLIVQCGDQEHIIEEDETIGLFLPNSWGCVCGRSLGQTVFLSKIRADSRYESHGKKTIHFKAADEVDLVYTLAHELRHSWQFQYGKDAYPALKLSSFEEYVRDPAEIDADAFAWLYTYKYYGDRLTSSRYLRTQMALANDIDFGARYARMAQLTEEYSLFLAA